jgi:hypothetical protein
MKGTDPKASSRWAEAKALTPAWGSVHRSPREWVTSFFVAGTTAWVLPDEGTSVLVGFVASAGLALVLLPLVEVTWNYFHVVPRVVANKEAARRRIKANGVALLADELRVQQERPAISDLDWAALERRFKSLEGHGLWLSRVNNSLSGHRWAIRGGGIAVAELEALCLKAGVMLMALPELQAILPDDVRQEDDPRLRWFKYVAGRCSYDSVSPAVTGTEGEVVEEGQTYRIDLLAEKSALLCLHLSAGEDRPCR